MPRPRAPSLSSLKAKAPASHLAESLPLRLSALQARLFAQDRLGLLTPFPDVASALNHHGYVQIDPINVCGRMHDLILRHRVRNYVEGDLMRFLHGGPSRPLPAQRKAFEHHLPEKNILVALPADAWPHLQGAMARRAQRAGEWSGRLTAAETALVPRLLDELAERGALSSGDLEDNGGRTNTGWGTSTLAKSTLQKLFFHGRLLIAGRVGNRRLYDLPECVLPAAVLATPASTLAEASRWEVLTKLRQRRLTPLKRSEVAWVLDCVQAVEIKDADVPRLYCLKEDVPSLDSLPRLSSAVRALAPLDPLIYDRRVTAGLWNFDYTWEVYTPAAKRKRGYYALPLLSGAELVGHIDPKMERTSGKLHVLAREVKRGHAWSEARHDLARFLGLT